MDSSSTLKEINVSLLIFLPRIFDKVSLFLNKTRTKGIMKVNNTKYPLETAVNLVICKKDKSEADHIR